MNFKLLVDAAGTVCDMAAVTVAVLRDMILSSVCSQAVMVRHWN
jgi:hypothetical protein